MEKKSFDTYSFAYEYIFSLLKNRRQARGELDVRHIIIVPDRFTLSVERKLMSDLGCNGAFDVSVMTFSRLIYNEGISVKYLSRYGGAMLIRRIIDENPDKADNENRFLCFNRALLNGGFPAQMYDTIMQLKSCLVSPDMLKMESEKSHLCNKLKDIRYIYTQYENFLKEHNLIDSSDKHKLLQESAKKSDIIHNAFFYFLGFDSMTPQAVEVVNALDNYSKGVIFTVIFDGAKYYPSVFGELKTPCDKLTDFHKHIYDNLFLQSGKEYNNEVPINIYQANSRPSMLKEACRIIKGYVRKGARYGDIALAGCLSEADRMILDESEIIYNFDHKMPLTSHPLVRFIKDIIDGVRTHYAEGTANIAKNYFSKITYEDACIYDNYCLKYSITRNIFMPFSIEEGSADFCIAQAVREKIAAILKPFERATGNCVIVSDYVNAVKNFISQNKLEKIFIEYNANQTTDEYRPFAKQCLDKLYAVLDEAEIISGYKLSLNDFRTMFFAGIDAVEISAIPSKTDAVYVTDTEGLRIENYAVIIYLDCMGGLFPMAEKDLGMLSDSDLEIMDKAKIYIEPKIRQVNKRKRTNLIQTFFLGNELYFLYCVDDLGEKRIRSSLLESIALTFPKHYENSEDRDNYLLRTAGESSEDLARFFYNRKLAEKLIYEYYGQAKTEHAKVLGGAISTAAKLLNIDFDNKIAPKDVFLNLQNTDTFSATQLENYFLCPYMYWTKQELKVKDRQIGDISALDIGSMLHKIVEKFSDKTPKNLIDCDNQIKSIVKGIIEENQKLKNNPHFAEKLLQEALALGRAIYEQNQYSDYKTVGSEVKFGNNEKLPALEIGASSGKAKITGTIDRIDRYKDFLRIIDYKSGKIKSSPKDIFAGNNLQLMLYMKACLEGYRVNPSASMYFPINNDFQKEDKQRFKMIGVLISDTDAVLAADKKLAADNLKSWSIPVMLKSITENGIEFNKNGSASVLSSEDFNGVMEYTAQVTAQAIDEIRKGYFEPNPCNNACDFCHYIGICLHPFQNERTFDDIDVKLDTVAEIGKKKLSKENQNIENK